MHHNPKISLPALMLAIMLNAGCAMAPAGQTPEKELRDTDQDLLFGTEYPVTSKGDGLLRADEARQAGDLDKALFFYVRALEFDPNDADLLAAIGLLHQYQKNDRLAVRSYSLALRARPDFVDVLEARGLILLKHEENETAAADLARAVELNPAAWPAHNGLGLLADRNEDHAAAIAHYDRALETSPDSAPVLNNRGYSKLLAGDAAGAEIDLRRATELGHKQAWVNLGTLFAQSGKYQRAVEAFGEALPRPEAFNKVAEASIENGDYEMAETLLEQAIRLSPVYFPAAEENLAQLQLLTSTAPSSLQD